MLRNRIEWPPFMSEIDDYVAALGKTQVLAARVSTAQADIEYFVRRMMGEPRLVATNVPDKWLDRADLVALLNEATAAFDDAAARYERLPNDAKPHVLPPCRTLGEATSVRGPVR